VLFRDPGLYTHRVAIFNHRLLHIDDNEVVFRTRHQGLYRISPLELMRRRLQHVPEATPARQAWYPARSSIVASRITGFGIVTSVRRPWRSTAWLRA
jgi:hypothetical protein